MIDLSLSADALTASIVDVPSPSGGETRLADEVEAALRGHSHLTVERDGDALMARTDIGAAHEVMIKSDKFDPKTMISPDSAKLIALCVVPGQIGSGEMNVTDGRTAYAITIIPNGKKTHSKVTVDARTGAVLSEKQFGGMRGLAGWVRESFEHEQNKTP